MARFNASSPAWPNGGWPRSCASASASVRSSSRPSSRAIERAAARITEIVAADGRDAALRVAVLAGGCSGFQYRFELDGGPQPDDLVIERGAAKVLVDPASLDLLAGSELDYTDELMGSHF